MIKYSKKREEELCQKRFYEEKRRLEALESKNDFLK